MKRYAVIIFLLFVGHLAAQPVLELREGASIRTIGKFVSIFEDSSARMSFEQVSAPAMAGKFIPAKNDVINFNVSESAFWCRIRIVNHSTDNDWYLQEAVGSLKLATCYVVSNGTVTSDSVGMRMPLEQRKIRMLYPMFHLPVSPDSSCTVYLRLVDNAPFQANLNVGQLRRFTEAEQGTSLFNGLYYGVLIVMMIYNLFVYFSIRERAYLYYVVYVFCTLLFMSYLNGMAMHFPQWFIDLTCAQPSITPCLFGVSALLFTVSFLDFRRNAPRSLKIAWALIGIIVLDVIAGFLGYVDVSIIVVQSLGLVMCLFAITTGFIVYRRGYQPAKFYLVSWGIYMIGLCVYILTDFGVLPFTPATHGAFQTGSLLEAVLLSVALADKVSGLKREKERAQTLALKAAQENEQLVREQNLVLEQKVKARTQEIEQQKSIIEEKNKDITDSIQYARRIQRVLLASDNVLHKNLPEYFLLYKPKDIVSGDFYWADEANDGTFLLLAGDCTGHGVPGAFMSLLNISMLNEIARGMRVVAPDAMLNTLRDAIITALNPEGAEEQSKDGMDGVLCRFDLRHMRMELACANNPVWLLRDGAFIEFKADKQPVGSHEGAVQPFTLHQTELKKGDTIYLFTDGFADQFGGPRGKKFKYKQLQETLTRVSVLSMSEQKTALEKCFDDWRGNLEQVDDVLVIGIRI